MRCVCVCVCLSVCVWWWRTGCVTTMVLVVVVRTWCNNDVSVDIAARVHLIRVAEHLGVLDDEELFVIEG